MKSKGIFVTGTDTNVGKTWVSVRLVRELRCRGVDAVGMKPIECGGYEDSQALLEASGTPGLTLEDINPVHFPEPLAPAAASEPVEIDFEKLKQKFERLTAQHDFVVVEGAGGWLVPIDESRTVADLAAHFALPVLVVAANRLGVLNHTLLTVGAIRTTSLSCCGVFLNQLDPDGDLSSRSNAKMLEKNLDEVPLIDQNLEQLVGLCLQSIQ
jgi:dethiobiotin synthetase